MSKKLRFLCILVCLFVSVSIVSAQHMTESTDDLTYHLTIPDTETPGLLIALHSTASSGKAMAALTGFDTYAERENLIIAYPDSPNLRWTMPDSDGDDTAAILAMLEEIQANYTIDSERIYLAGYGTGGILAMQLFCTASDNFSGVAVAASMPVEQVVNSCENPIESTDLLIIRSEEDLFYTRNGNPDISSLGVNDTLNFFGDLMNCATDESANETELRYKTALQFDCENDNQLAFMR